MSWLSKHGLSKFWEIIQSWKFKFCLQINFFCRFKREKGKKILSVMRKVAIRIFGLSEQNNKLSAMKDIEFREAKTVAVL